MDTPKKMKAINLGIAKIPLEGDFNFAAGGAGILHGLLWVLFVFNINKPKGPALHVLFDASLMQQNPNALHNGGFMIEALSKTLFVTALWSFVYYAYIGVQIGAIFNIMAFDIIKKDDVTDQYIPTAARWAGNMFEQSPVFLSLVWAYTLFVDYETGGNLGILYMVSRLLYPLIYIKFGKFVMWFEFITQPGYGSIGVFMLGLFVNSIAAMTGKADNSGKGGIAWTDWCCNDSACDNVIILPPLLGFFIGSLGIWPYSNPIAILYGFIYYKVDHYRKLRMVSRVAAE